MNDGSSTRPGPKDPSGPGPKDPSGSGPKDPSGPGPIDGGSVDRDSADQGPIDQGPIDLGPIDPTGDPERFERTVVHLRGLARGELVRRARSAAPGATGGGWMRAIPAFWGRAAWPAAAAISLASLGILHTRDAAVGATVEEELARAVGVPEALAVWMGVEVEPALPQILSGWEEQE